MKNNKDDNKKNKLVTYLKVSGCVLVFLLLVLIVLLFILLTDKNRSTYKRRNIEYSEVIKKNYIDGFANCENSQEFSYILPKDDVNELLAIGKDSLNDKHIENIYYDYDEMGYRYFYVDLTKVIFKTRVVITTIPSIKDSSTVLFSISECKVGKLNAFGFLEQKGYLKSDFLNNYFNSCHLPITYDESLHAFEVTPFSWIDEFPDSEIGGELFEQAKTTPNTLYLNSNLFGFDVILSNLKTNAKYTDVDVDNIPKIPDEIRSKCESEYSSLGESESKTIYSISEETLNKLIKSSLVSNQKEEFTSSWTSNTLCFDLKGINVHLDVIDKVKISLFYSINGYLLDKEIPLTYVDSSPTAFVANFTCDTSSSNVINKSINNAFSLLSNKYSYIKYKNSNKTLSIDMEDMNDEFTTIDLKYCPKAIEINPSTHSLDFKITKL